MSALVPVMRRRIWRKSSDPPAACSGIERSARFVEAARERCARRGLTNVEIREGDLMEMSLGDLEYDASWCRWVASFVASPEKLVENIAGALRPGGVAIFHEYSDYLTFRFMPIKPALERFSLEVMESWIASGGEPNVARRLPELLTNAGFRVLEIIPARAHGVAARLHVAMAEKLRRDQRRPAARARPRLRGVGG